jgi:hypothetical protein
MAFVFMIDEMEAYIAIQDLDGAVVHEPRGPDVTPERITIRVRMAGWEDFIRGMELRMMDEDWMAEEMGLGS